MERLQKDGFLVLEGIFTEAEVLELKEAGLQLTKDIPKKEDRVIFNTTQSPQSKNRYFLESGDKVRPFFESDALDDSGELKVAPELALNKVGHALHILNPVFQKYTYSERVREICWRIGMKDPLILQSMYIYKNPGVGSEVTPHQDATFLHTTPEDRVLGFWIALDDATIENGCLWFASGSHRSGVHRRFMRNPDPNAEELLIFDSPLPTYPTSNFKPVPVSKGSCILIHGQVVHKSQPNNSSQSRHAYTFHVADLQDATYSASNWLQPPEGGTFPKLYEKPPIIL